MKQSTIVLLFGLVYALIALFSNEPLSLIYASFAGVTGILHVLLDIEERRKAAIYRV